MMSGLSDNGVILKRQEIFGCYRMIIRGCWVSVAIWEYSGSISRYEKKLKLKGRRSSIHSRKRGPNVQCLS
jgi:hypothetical protein